MDFFNINFFQKMFQEYHRGVEHLDPNQALRFVGHAMDPNCLQRLSADDKSRHWRGKSLNKHQGIEEVIVSWC